MNHKSLAAVMIALACASVARAAEPQSAGVASDLSLTPTYLDDQTPTTLTPVNYWLSSTSVGQTLANNKISIGGFVEGGYFYDTNNPRLGAGARGDAPTDIGFPGSFSNRGLLDQADLMVQKTIDTSKSFDIGFQFEQGYGTDFASTHSYGLLDNRAAPTLYDKFNETSPDSSAGSPQNQYDIIQANVSFLVPLGAGLTIEAGKFVTLLGYETINPTTNQFYTHSYLFTFGIPLTQTGILGSYTFGKLINGNDLTVTAGITRGWNESTLDNNGEIDFLGEAKANITQNLGFTLNVSEGPESYEAFAGDKGDSHNYWTTIEAIPTYQVSDQLTLALDALYVDFPHGALVPAAAGDVPGESGKSAQWYSLTGYAGYKFNSYVTLNGRLEWYGDQGGYSVDNSAPLGPISANYYEVTVGTQIHPLPTNDIFQWLQFRPELRYDWADHSVYDANHVDGRGAHGEFTVAMDAIMQF